MIRLRLRSLIVVALMVAAPTPARASAAVLVSGPASSAAGFFTPAVVAAKSLPLTHVNADNGAQHNVQSIAYGPSSNPWCAGFAANRCPLFWSPLINFGETAPVVGLGALTTGQTYAFKCVLHGAMTGTLVAV